MYNTCRVNNQISAGESDDKWRLARTGPGPRNQIAAHRLVKGTVNRYSSGNFHDPTEFRFGKHMATVNFRCVTCNMFKITGVLVILSRSYHVIVT